MIWPLLWILTTISVILLVILTTILLFYFGIGTKTKWVFAALGFIYAALPLWADLTYKGSGDPGPLWLFMFPPFWPQVIIFVIPTIFLSLFGASLKQFNGPVWKIVFWTVNILFWTGAGYFLGSVIGSKMGASKRKKLITIAIILGVLLLLAGIYFFGRGIWF